MIRSFRPTKGTEHSPIKLEGTKILGDQEAEELLRIVLTTPIAKHIFEEHQGIFEKNQGNRAVILLRLSE
jgi:hypothetical protein